MYEYPCDRPCCWSHLACRGASVRAEYGIADLRPEVGCTQRASAWPILEALGTDVTEFFEHGSRSDEVVFRRTSMRVLEETDRRRVVCLPCGPWSSHHHDLRGVPGRNETRRVREAQDAENGRGPAEVGKETLE